MGDKASLTEEEIAELRPKLDYLRDIGRLNGTNVGTVLAVVEATARLLDEVEGLRGGIGWCRVYRHGAAENVPHARTARCVDWTSITAPRPAWLATEAK